VTFDPKLASSKELVAAIKQVGFDAVVVDAPTTSRSEAPNRLDQDELPDDLRALLAQANEANKAVLMQFTGPD
jgi:hypothetical protein